MNPRIVPALAVLASFAVAGSAIAQSGSTKDQATAQSQSAIKAPPAQATASAEAAGSMQAGADVKELHRRITERANKLSTRARLKADQRLKESAERVDANASKAGEQVVATRLASEFGLTSDAVVAEHQATGASWGELMIAHTLAANSTDAASFQQLLALRGNGMGWGSIAAGLGFNLGSVVSNVNVESRIASGLAQADGKVATIRSDAASANPSAAAGMHAGVGAGAAGAGVRGTVGAGVGVQAGR